MNKILATLFCSVIALVLLVGCAGEQERAVSSNEQVVVESSSNQSVAEPSSEQVAAEPSSNQGSSEPSKDQSTAELNVLLIASDRATLEAVLEDNAATAELVALLQAGPITVNLHEYGGFEMIGGLPQDLPTADEQISTSTGDIVLYQGRQISFFYASNSWSYTRLGHIDGYNGAALLEALGGPYDSTVELSLKE